MENTLVDTLNKVNELGYLKDYSVSPWKEKLQHNTADFYIDRVYRFEGLTNPEDEAILYTISSKNEGLNGYLVNGYGIYSIDWIDQLVAKLSVRK
jgi:hypothetical protein